MTAVRPRGACVDCGLAKERTRAVAEGRVCMGCFADRRRRRCPTCGEFRPPARREPGTACALCQTRSEAAGVLAGHRDVIVAAVVAVDPDVAPDAVGELVERVTPHREQRRLLAAAVSVDVDWCAGSTVAPVAVERLIAGLCELGSTRFRMPCCGECGRVAHCVGRRPDGARLCKACDHRRRTVDCVICGRHRPVGGVLSDGTRVCGPCRRSHPERLEPCSDCGQPGIVHRRRDDGRAICPRCYMRRARALEEVPGLIATCIDCGRHGFCIGVTTGEPRCPRCHPSRTAPCARCGQTRRVAVVWAAGPHCNRCRQQILDSSGTCEACGQVRRIDPRNTDGRRVCSPCAGLEPLSTCTTCGTEARLWNRGQCDACTLGRRLDALFAGAPADVAVQLAPLRTALSVDGSHRTTLEWLTRSLGLIAQLFDGTVAVSHGALDAVDSRPGEHLRHLLVTAGILPARNEPLARLERWLAEQLAGIDNAEDRHFIDTFATWQVLRRCRQRAERIGATASTTAARRTIRAAIELLVWLRARQRPLAKVNQADVDLWVATGPPARRAARQFLAWAHSRRLAPKVSIAAQRVPLPASTLTAEQLQAFVHRLATDASLPTVDRAAGLLVALYGQPATRLARLRVSDVTITGDTVGLRLGRHKVDLPAVLGGLVATLLAERRGPARTGNPATSEWLFPGGQPGRPLTPSWLAARIAAHGLPVASLRTAALLELAGELPAAFLADLLGISAGTAVRWTQAAGGEWANYAAVRARSTR